MAIGMSGLLTKKPQEGVVCVEGFYAVFILWSGTQDALRQIQGGMGGIQCFPHIDHCVALGHTIKPSATN